MNPTPPPPPQMLLSGLQTGINRVLHYDPETRAALAQLSGRVIAIETTRPAYRLFLVPEADGIGIRAVEPERVDVSIAGRPTALLGMIVSRQEAGSQGHVEIRGDIHLAQRFQQILHAADIDWEEFVATYFGDTAAHHLGRFGRRLGRFLEEAGRSLVTQFSEYLRYEQTVLPPRHEIERFSAAVDTLRDDVERAQQRLQRLEKRRGDRP